MGPPPRAARIDLRFRLFGEADLHGFARRRRSISSASTVFPSSACAIPAAIDASSATLLVLHHFVDRDELDHGPLGQVGLDDEATVLYARMQDHVVSVRAVRLRANRLLLASKQSPLVREILDPPSMLGTLWHSPTVTGISSAASL